MVTVCLFFVYFIFPFFFVQGEDIAERSLMSCNKEVC